MASGSRFFERTPHEVSALREVTLFSTLNCRGSRTSSLSYRVPTSGGFADVTSHSITVKTFPTGHGPTVEQLTVMVTSRNVWPASTSTDALSPIVTGEVLAGAVTAFAGGAVLCL
ncbi:hypothetical protein PspLS_07081 [Pyricularia sp. CBS 133598]|nr:hypothetical protein PspLS_07081 [Pyricularia sp. CBS 133598]